MRMCFGDQQKYIRARRVCYLLPMTMATATTMAMTIAMATTTTAAAMSMEGEGILEDKC